VGYLDELVGVIRGVAASGEAIPGPRAVAGEGAGVALSASGASETDRACGHGLNAGRADVATDPGLVTVVDGELEAVAVRGVELEEIEIPHDLSTIGVDGGLVVGGVDEADGEGVRASAKVPASVGSIAVGRRVAGGGDVEDIAKEDEQD